MPRSFLKSSQIWKKKVMLSGITNNTWRRCLSLKNDIILLLSFLSLGVRYEQQNNTSNFPYWYLGQYVMTNWNHDKDNAHQAWHWFNTWIVMKYCTISFSLNTQWFMLNSFKQMMPFFKSIHDGEKFYIMNFIINLHRRKLKRIKVDKIKKIVFSKLWKYGTYFKVGSVHF